MATVVIELPPETYAALQDRAERAGKSLEALSRELLETALQHQAAPARSTREILEAAGMLREIGPTLQSKIIPGVTLEDVREALSRGGGPPLSEILLEQRGPKE